MNEFVAKKLGEVLAFAHVSKDTFTRGKDSLISLFEEETYNSFVKGNETHEANILTFIQDSDKKDVTMTKAEGTGKKLTTMRDLYVADQWDNPTELMEWSGFFEGAAIVHWKLVLGAAEGLNDENLISLAQDAILLHEQILTKAGEHLHETGQERAQK